MRQTLAVLIVFFFQAEDGIRDSSVTGVQTCALLIQAEDGIRDSSVTGVQTCALPISGFWKEFAKQNPHAFDSRVQLFDRLAKGDDMITAIGEYPAYILFKGKGAQVEFVAPPDGLVTTPLIFGPGSQRPHPEAAKLFGDLGM